MRNCHDRELFLLDMVKPSFFSLIYVHVVDVHQLVSRKLILLSLIIIAFIFNSNLKYIVTTFFYLWKRG